MRKLSIWLSCLLLCGVANASVEFFVRRGPHRMPGAEVCFYKMAPKGATPAEFWFLGNDVRCLPADYVLDIPVGRFRFFGRGVGYITPADNSFSKTAAAPPGAYKALELTAVPSATFDITGLSLNDGQWFGVLAAPDATGIHGGFFPAPAGATTIDVPAGTPLLPLIIEHGTPVGVGRLVKLREGAKERPSFPERNDRGNVITWIEYDRNLVNDPRVDEAGYGNLATVLRTKSGVAIEPVFAITNPYNAHGLLQIFTDVPPGPATIAIDGEKWEAGQITAVAVAGATTLTSEPVRPVFAGIIRVHYQLPGSVRPSAAQVQACEDRPTAPVTIALLRCPGAASAGDPVDTSTCTVLQKKDLPAEGTDVTFTRVPLGSVLIEAQTPGLGPTRTTIAVRPNEQHDIALTPKGFALFGRVTRGEQAVRATITFGAGRSTGTAVSGTDGRYEIMLPDDPKDNAVYVRTCDGMIDYKFFPPTTIASGAFDIALPNSALQVVVRDHASDEKVPQAVVFCSVNSGTDDEYRLRATTDATGRARFPVVPDKTRLRVCATAPATGYTKSACSDAVELKDGEDREVTLRLERTGKIHARVTGATGFAPLIFAHVAANGAVKQRGTTEEEGWWLHDLPGPGDYFVIMAPGKPLYVIPSWSTENDELVIALPPVPLRTFRVTGGTNQTRVVGLRVGGRLVPLPLVLLHLANRRINPTITWPLPIPEVAETGPIAVIVGPPATDLPAWVLEGADLFTLPGAEQWPVFALRPGADTIDYAAK